jgi:hypothetical protein
MRSQQTHKHIPSMSLIILRLVNKAELVTTGPLSVYMFQASKQKDLRSPFSLEDSNLRKLHINLYPPITILLPFPYLSVLY